MLYITWKFQYLNRFNLKIELNTTMSEFFKFVQSLGNLFQVNNKDNRKICENWQVNNADNRKT